MAKKDGKRVADVVNVALKAFIEGDYEEPILSSPSIDIEDDDFVLSIDDEGEIKLSKNDIYEISEGTGKFTIKTSGNLFFEKDVDKSALDRIKGIIVQSGNVKIPKNTYPLFLLKSHINGTIEKY
ncbi:MAG: hypothetical protein ACOC80_13910 [Petrotogales bacterium]